MHLRFICSYVFSVLCSSLCQTTGCVCYSQSASPGFYLWKLHILSDVRSLVEYKGVCVFIPVLLLKKYFYGKNSAFAKLFVSVCLCCWTRF